MLLFFGEGLSLQGLVGNLAAIASGVAFALMMVCMRAEKDGDPAEVVRLGSLASAAIGAPWVLLQSWTLADTGVILYLGLFQISLAFILYAHAIRRVRAVESVLVLTLEPVLNPIWVLLVLGERPGAMAVLGGTVVIGAVLGRALFGARRARGLTRPPRACLMPPVRPLSSESTFFPWERRLSSAKAGDSGRDDRGGTPLPQRIITFFPE